MAMTIVEGTCSITGGVDTHLDVHVAAALDPDGALLGLESFGAGPDGYAALLVWLEHFGEVVGEECAVASAARLETRWSFAPPRIVDVLARNDSDRRRFERPRRHSICRDGSDTGPEAVESDNGGEAGREEGQEHR
jgi:hypothetical protein